MTPGSVCGIHVSNGGVPKHPLETAAISRTGLAGDRQQDPRHHGGPDRAVVLYSLELIQDLRAEGHPIAPGSIGENLTVTGLDWLALHPGVRLQINDVVLEITRAAEPCRKLTASFAGGRFSRVSETANPGWSRWCAKVLQEGTVKVDDPVVVL